MPVKENNTLTTKWYQHRQIVRCLSLIPNNGIAKDLFTSSLDPDLQVEARNCIAQGKFITLEGDRIRPLSPLLFYGVHPTQDQILSFLSGLYIVLEDVIDRYRKPEINGIDEEAEQLCQQFDRLKTAENLSELELQLLEHIAPLINQLRMKRIGSLEHLKDEIKKVRNAVEMACYRRYGNERKDALRAFHEEKGKDICAVFNNTMDRIPLGSILRENMLDLMVQYYELTESMFQEMADAAKQLLELQLERGAPAWLLSDTYMKLSDSNLATFKTNSRWLELSNYYLEKSCEYARLAWEEEEKAQSAQEV